MVKQGLGSTIKPTTISDMITKVAKYRGSNPALRVMRNGKELIWSWSRFHLESMQFAKALMQLGIPQRRSVNIMGFNSPEWAIACFGSIFHNNVVSGVYITNGVQACKY